MPSFSLPGVSRHVPARASAPETWYHADAVRPFDAQPALSESRTADVVIVGAGFTGLSAALDLAEAGMDVVVLEAASVGAGASGRNGGLMCSGWRHDQPWFETRMGNEAALALWRLVEEAKADLLTRAARYGIDLNYRAGLVFAAHAPSMMGWLDDDAAHLSGRYGYTKMTRLDGAACAEALGTDVYHGGWRDEGAGRIQPLRLLYGLAAAALAAGATIHEATRVTSIGAMTGGRLPVTSSTGATIHAARVLLCGDGYLDGLEPSVERAVMPIGSFVIATEPLPADSPVMAAAAGAMDTRFVVNYFQKTEDNRLIFGGGEKYTPSWPADIESFVRVNLARVFPDLADIRITHAWGGALGITPTRLPLVRAVRPGVTVASGYSGQGVVLAPWCGRLLARAVIEKSDPDALIASLPVPAFPGGRLLRWPLLAAAITWYALRDRLA